MAKKVRWGLMSTARINNQVIPAIHKSRKGELAAVASRDEAKAQKYAELHKIPLSFGNYEAMLASPDVDAVYISLPNHLHAEWAVKAMQAGKHVLCEKPLALTMQEVEAMLNASKLNKVYLTEAFMYLHHPQMQIVKEILDNKEIGDVHTVRAHFSFFLSNPNDIRLIPEYGGGSIWDVGVYPVSLAQFIFDAEPEHVQGYQVLGNTGVDMSFVGNLSFSGGRLAQISSSIQSPTYTWAEVLGTKGRLTMNRPFNEQDRNRKVILTDEDGKEREIRIPNKELYLGEIEDMNRAILDGEEPLISHERMAAHIRTILRLIESAKNPV